MPTVQVCVNPASCNLLQRTVRYGTATGAARLAGRAAGGGAAVAVIEEGVKAATSDESVDEKVVRFVVVGGLRVAGGIGGGMLGGAGGTLVEPGVGTAIGAFAVGAAGSEAGGRLGEGGLEGYKKLKGIGGFAMEEVGRMSQPEYWISEPR